MIYTTGLIEKLVTVCIFLFTSLFSSKSVLNFINDDCKDFAKVVF